MTIIVFHAVAYQANAYLTYSTGIDEQCNLVSGTKPIFPIVVAAAFRYAYLARSFGPDYANTDRNEDSSAEHHNFANTFSIPIPSLRLGSSS